MPPRSPKRFTAPRLDQRIDMKLTRQQHERFSNPSGPLFSRIIPEPMSGCWLWMGERQGLGYGVFRLESDGTRHRVTRIVWALTQGEIDDSLFACHKCDNPGCVNPDHIFLGTAKDNIADAVKKGRNYKGGSKSYPARDMTHCKRGHPLSGTNIYSGRRRQCKACHKMNEHARRDIINANRRARKAKARLTAMGETGGPA